MVRPKGGRSQPRYYYYKQAGENKLVKLLGDRTMPSRKKMSKVDELCQQMKFYSQAVDNLLAAARKNLEEIKKITNGK